MRVAKNKFLIEVNDQFVRPNISGLKFVDTDYNPKVLATKIGRIHTLPIALEGLDYHFDLKLNVGDEVVFNHMVCQDRNKFQENIFFCDYFNIYGLLLNDKIYPLEETLFCEKIMEPDVQISCLKIPGKVSDKCATVFELSTKCYEAGIRKGDIVYFTKNADYPMEIFGNEFYKMHLRNIIGIERDGQLTTFRNKLLVKNITELGEVGGVKRIYAHNSLQTGVVINAGTVTGIPVGTKLTYFNASATSMNWEGEEYSFIDELNIKYLTDDIKS